MEDLEKAIRGIFHAYRALAICDYVRKSAQSGFTIRIPIVKLAEEKREVTGVVLKPEVVDAQGDVISAEAIEEAAGDYLSKYNAGTKLGYMHKEFKAKRFALRQSYVAPSDVVIANRIYKAGTWIMVVKALKDKDWKAIKNGEINGFSIGGRLKNWTPISPKDLALAA